MKMLAHERQCIVDRIEIMSHRQWKVALATPARFDVFRPSQFCRESLPDPLPRPRLVSTRSAYGKGHRGYLYRYFMYKYVGVLSR